MKIGDLVIVTPELPGLEDIAGKEATVVEVVSESCLKIKVGKEILRIHVIEVRKV